MHFHASASGRTASPPLPTAFYSGHLVAVLSRPAQFHATRAKFEFSRNSQFTNEPGERPGAKKNEKKFHFVLNTATTATARRVASISTVTGSAADHRNALSTSISFIKPARASRANAHFIGQ